MDERITMNHGSGGAATGELIHRVFASAFQNDTLSAMEDAAVVPWRRNSGSELSEDFSKGNRLAITTDSFVVTPVEFRGGDIGRLAVCGSVNDLMMRGAIPQYLTSSWILETGLAIDILERAVRSMAETAKEAGVSVVCGDTKVVEGQGGIYVNTTCVGYVPEGVDIAAGGAKPGDVILVSGTMGDHHAAILSERMSVESDIASDVAPLTELCAALRPFGVHTLRDVTRGGLATVLKELATASGQVFTLDEETVPVAPKVRDFSGLLGLDTLYMGNEGKLVAIVAPEDATAALDAMKTARYGANAAIIGEVTAPDFSAEAGSLFARTSIGGLRELDVLQGEGLPRIC